MGIHHRLFLAKTKIQMDKGAITPTQIIGWGLTLAIVTFGASFARIESVRGEVEQNSIDIAVTKAQVAALTDKVADIKTDTGDIKKALGVKP